MTAKREIYRCELCGQVVEVLTAGGGELWCCGQAMQKMTAGSNDQGAREKHVPVIEQTDDGYVVKVGEVAHPMTSEHWIEWIELNVDGQSMREFLTLEDEARAEFRVAEGKHVSARAYCNLHGLWEIGNI